MLEKASRTPTGASSLCLYHPGVILHVSMFCESLNACWQENTSILPRNQSTRAGGS
jgi:hypothetical protein